MIFGMKKIIKNWSKISKNKKIFTKKVKKNIKIKKFWKNNQKISGNHPLITKKNSNFKKKMKKIKKFWKNYEKNSGRCRSLELQLVFVIECPMIHVGNI